MYGKLNVTKFQCMFKNWDACKDSQKIKIKKKTKTPRITDEGWNSRKRLSDPVKKMKEGRKDSCIFIQSSLHAGLVPL